MSASTCLAPASADCLPPGGVLAQAWEALPQATASARNHCRQNAPRHNPLWPLTDSVFIPNGHSNAKNHVRGQGERESEMGRGGGGEREKKRHRITTQKFASLFMDTLAITAVRMAPAPTRFGH